MRDDAFIFAGRTWDTATGTAGFTYEVIHNGELFSFTDTLIFPTSQSSSDVPQDLFDRVLDNLSLILGTSYYKLFCPPTIELQTIRLNQDQAAFWNTVYTKGLGEFFYKNKIDFRGLVAFPVSEGTPAAPIAFERKDRSLVGIGGGKDSIVAAELLKEHHKPISAFVVNEHPIRNQTIEVMQVNKVTVTHKIDPLLLELNKREDAYNGHVPVSAHYAFTGLLTALLCDYRYVIVSNEQSANYGNTDYLGEEVNHQWSKSLKFESMFQEYVRTYLTPSVVYFSLLRPYTELAIAQKLTKYPQYFPVFSSCNRNFKIQPGQNKRWCGECAKCAFSFIMLAAFLPKEQVVQLFGKNLLADESLLQTYKELLGTAEIKPFDCVGTPDEVRAAFSLAKNLSDYKDDPVMQYFTASVLQHLPDVEALEKQALQPAGEHLVPESFTEVLTYDN